MVTVWRAGHGSETGSELCPGVRVWLGETALPAGLMATQTERTPSLKAVGAVGGTCGDASIGGHSGIQCEAAGCGPGNSRWPQAWLCAPRDDKVAPCVGALPATRQPNSPLGEKPTRLEVRVAARALVRFLLETSGSASMAGRRRPHGQLGPAAVASEVHARRAVFPLSCGL